MASDRNVYSVYGHHVGTLSKEPRILRPREWSFASERRPSPPAPAPIRLPSHVPLPPLMSEIAQNLIDVLADAPHLLPPLGGGELNADMD